VCDALHEIGDILQKTITAE